MKKFTLLLVTAFLMGCTTSEIYYKHSDELVQSSLNEKTKNYNEKQDGLIYGINLNEPGPQGLIFNKIDSETGAKAYSKWEYTTHGRIRTNLQLDESDRIIQIERYWFGFPRDDMEAILVSQKQLFENNYSIKLNGLTVSGERWFLTKDELFNELKGRSVECNNRCLRVLKNEKGISKVISSAGYNYYWLSDDASRFVHIQITTRLMKAYRDRKTTKYQ